MMRTGDCMYKVTYSAGVQAQFAELFFYVANLAGAETAEALVGDLLAGCEGLCRFPRRGTCRDDLYPGLRVTAYAHKSRKASIAYLVKEDAGLVVIVGVFYGGQSIETFFSDAPDDI